MQFLQPPLGPPPRVRRGDALDWKRKAVWNNACRNDYIALLADALSRRNERQLEQLGVFLTADDLARSQSVAILVESVEHGRELHRRLDGWELWTQVPRNSGNESISSQSVDLFKLRACDKVIMTLVSASRQTEIDAHILIRADGTRWPLMLDGFPTAASASDSEVQMIDLADDLDKLSRAATQARLRDYRRLGWQIGSLPVWLQTAHESSRHRSERA